MEPNQIINLRSIKSKTISVYIYPNTIWERFFGQMSAPDGSAGRISMNQTTVCEYCIRGGFQRDCRMVFPISSDFVKSKSRRIWSGRKSPYSAASR